jgi:hypothetical protein
VAQHFVKNAERPISAAMLSPPVNPLPSGLA